MSNQQTQTGVDLSRRKLIVASIQASLLSACSATGRQLTLLELNQFPQTGLYRFAARSDQSFHWPYYLYVPKKLAPNARLLVLGPNNVVSANLGRLERELRSWFRWIAPGLSEPLGMPVLLAAFIRPRTDDPAQNLYTHGLSRAAMETELETLRRVDLQTLAMVDDAQNKLRTAKIQLKDNQILVTGYSAGADFAQRMTLLHPHRVLAVAAGGIGGLPTLPISRLAGTKLTYPLGIADLAQLTGCSFDAEAYRRTPHLLIQGAKDNNDSVGFLDSYSVAQSQFARRELGRKPIDRIEAVTQIFSEFGMHQFDFRVHAGDGHRLTERYFNELVAWFQDVSKLGLSKVGSEPSATGGGLQCSAA